MLSHSSGRFSHFVFILNSSGEVLAQSSYEALLFRKRERKMRSVEQSLSHRRCILIAICQEVQSGTKFCTFQKYCVLKNTFLQSASKNMNWSFQPSFYTDYFQLKFKMINLIVANRRMPHTRILLLYLMPEY